MPNPTLYVETVPCRTPRASGLFAITDPRSIEDRVLAVDGLEYEAVDCGLIAGDAQTCWNGVDNTATPKRLASILTGKGFTFAGYAGVECYLGPGHDEVFREKAVAMIESSEERYVESKIVERMHGLNAANAQAVTEVQGLIDAETYADQHYVGTPILWMSRATALRLAAANYLVRENGMLMSQLGTPVLATDSFALSTAHPRPVITGLNPNHGPVAGGTAVVATGTFPQAGAGAPINVSDSIYITGCVTLYRSDIVTNGAINPRTNRQAVIAERGYGVIVDCDFQRRYAVQP